MNIYDRFQEKKEKGEGKFDKRQNATMKSDFVYALPDRRAAWNLGKISRMAQRNCAERERERDKQKEAT